MSSAPRQSTVACPYCGEQILAAAKKCKHCGEYLDESVRPPEPAPEVVIEREWSPGIAAVLSFFVPGAGQLYKGQILAGLLWFVCVSLGYVAFVIPGIVLHVLCIFGAASGDPYAGARRVAARFRR